MAVSITNRSGVRCQVSERAEGRRQRAEGKVDYIWCREHLTCCRGYRVSVISSQHNRNQSVGWVAALAGTQPKVRWCWVTLQASLRLRGLNPSSEEVGLQQIQPQRVSRTGIDFKRDFLNSAGIAKLLSLAIVKRHQHPPSIAGSQHQFLIGFPMPLASFR